MSPAHIELSAFATTVKQVSKYLLTQISKKTKFHKLNVQDIKNTNEIEQEIFYEKEDDIIVKF